jgi:hypothetical protein
VTNQQKQFLLSAITDQDQVQMIVHCLRYGAAEGEADEQRAERLARDLEPIYFDLPDDRDDEAQRALDRRLSAPVDRQQQEGRR